MKLVSTFAPATSGKGLQLAEPGLADSIGSKNVVLAVFDTFIDGKSLVVGIAVGELAGPAKEDARVSPVGQAVLNRLAEYHHFRYPESDFIVAGVASVASATERVRKVLQQAPAPCAVLLLCADDKIYDKAFTALNVDLQAMARDPQ